MSHTGWGRTDGANESAVAANALLPSTRHENIRLKFHINEAVWFQRALPWVVPGTYNFASVDFTPNYLCSQEANLA